MDVFGLRPNGRYLWRGVWNTRRYCWHGHHANVCPIERLDGSFEERREQILQKPIEQQPTRLKLFRRCSQEAVALFTQYEAAERSLRERYEAAERPLFAQYEAAERPLWTQYEAAERPLFAQYGAAERPLFAQYEAGVRPLRERYEAAKRPLFAQYEAAERLLRERYEAAKRSVLAPILALHATECVPDCPWDGYTIFPVSIRSTHDCRN